MSKGKRNFLLVLISVMVGIIYFIPYLRFFFYDQMLDGFHLTNLQLARLGRFMAWLPCSATRSAVTWPTVSARVFC